RPALDGALAGAQAVEDDPKVTSVGFGGLPNAVGTVQLDACVMDGATLSCGGVAGLENVRHPAALARRVMEKTPHAPLLGEGARWFAIQQGFPLESLHTPESLAEWEKKKARKGKGPPTPGPSPTKGGGEKKKGGEETAPPPSPRLGEEGRGGEGDFSHDTVTV